MIDEFVIMPNHLPGVIFILGDNNGRGTVHRAPTPKRFGKPISNSIPLIIRSFKATVTQQINELRSTPGKSIWQRNYFERVIRDEDESNRIREYILQNPAKWAEDKENPVNWMAAD